MESFCPFFFLRNPNLLWDTHGLLPAIDMKLNTHLKSRLRMSGVTTLLPLYVSIDMYRINFTSAGYSEI
jgi:hypothetical protein